MEKVIALLALCLSLASQKVQIINPQPYGNPDWDGPEYLITQPNFTYRGEYEQLQDIDYKNFVLHTFDRKGGHFICGQLNGGYWEAIVENGTSLETLKWRQSYPLRSEPAVPQEILVIFDYWGASGSSGGDGYAQVWRLEDNRITIVEQIRFDTDSAGHENKNFSYDAKSQQLRIRASHYLPGDAHCCISAYDELTFRWEDGLFTLVKKETKPTHSATVH